jgi:AraC-like DNA-binding protein
MDIKNALETAVTYIEEHYMEQLSLEDLMRVCGVSKYSLTRLFKKKFNSPPQRWIWCFRIFVAKNILRYWPSVSCREVAFACGFETPAHFSRMFRTIVGVTPKAYRLRILQNANLSDDIDPQQSSLAALAHKAFINQEQGVLALDKSIQS